MASTKFGLAGGQFKLNFATPKANFSEEDSKKKRDAVNKAIAKGVTKGTTYVEKGLRKHLDQAMESPVWGPSVATIPYQRKTGKTIKPGAMSSLVDTGKLKNSLEIKPRFLQSKTEISVKYKMPYANMIHYGGVIYPYGNKSGGSSVLIPARPWVEAVMVGGYNGIERYNPDPDFNKGLQEAWSAQFG